MSKWRQLASRVLRGTGPHSASDAETAEPATTSDLGTVPDGLARPRLRALAWEGTTAQVELGGLGVLPPSSPLLVVGRKSEEQVAVDLDGGDDIRSARITPDDLSPFGSETLDLFVETPGGRHRHRIAAAGSAVPEQLGAPRRFYVTKQGNVSLRRKNAAEIIGESGTFDAEFYRSQVPELPGHTDLIEHYLTEGAGRGLNPSAMFDSRYYLENNPLVVRWNPLAHYCEHGWRQLRNPSPGFSTWWYWAKHLDFSDQSINPLAHYQSVGRQRGLSTLPDQRPSRQLTGGYRCSTAHGVRRICLFGAYDPDGIVDDYVVEYVRELSRFADVFFLADCELSATELAKLTPYVCGAWAERHGEYDFGSYARLAERVGWASIEQYDELLLVNDSCYLLRPLDEVFVRMADAECDWWGLQATKGLYQTREQPQNSFDEPIPMHDVRTRLVDAFENDYIYDFHIASFFVAYREPVIQDPEFRRYLTSVTPQVRKRDIVKKYEIGMTHWLIQHGHSFDTFVPVLYPFHPVFTHWYFRMLADGFPLLKRQLFSENLYRVPGLAHWHELVSREVPSADLSVIDRNLARVVDPDKLRLNLEITDPTA